MIRQIPSRPDSIFLTFDDGPDNGNTQRVLDILKSRGAHATFFLVGNRMRNQRPLVQRMVDEGHALGNHSWDHRYRNYFLGRQAMRRWICEAREEFSRLDLPEPVGFRPPAGVITPVVKKVAGELGEPLVMWNERFYDRVRVWDFAKASRSSAAIAGGSVVLLHDRRRANLAGDFFGTLESYVDQLQARGFRLEALSRDLCAVKAK